MAPYFRPGRLGKQLDAQGRRYKQGPPYGNWYISYRDASGRKVRTATKAQTYEEALHLNLDVSRLEDHIRRGWATRPKPITPMVWEELAEKYLEGNRRLISQHTIKSQIKVWLTPHFAGRPIATIATADCAALLAKAYDAGLVDSSVREIHRRGHVVWQYAIETLQVLQTNPWDKVKPPKPPKKEPVFLRRDQVEALLLAAGKDRLLLVTAVLAGMRRCELGGLLWTDIDWDAGAQGVIHVRRSWSRVSTKNKKGRPVPLHPYLREQLLAARRATTSAWVFPSPKTGRMRSTGWNVGKLLHRAMARAGLQEPPGLTFHSLRATFITHLLHTTGDIAAAQRLAGHSTPTLTERTYAGHDLGYLERAVQSLPYGGVALIDQTGIQPGAAHKNPTHVPTHVGNVVALAGQSVVGAHT